MNQHPNVTKESIKSVLTALVGAFSAESDAEARASEVYPVIRGLVASHDPEDFYFAARRTIDKVFETAIKDQAGVSDPCALAIWMNWNFFSRFLTDLCQRFYGSPCCADRARWVLNSYLRWKETGSMPVLGTAYFHPATGTAEEWMNLVQGICDLQHGRFTSFAMAYQALSISFRAAADQSATTNETSAT